MWGFHVSFQIKDFPSIVASEINHARAVTDKITDFVPGSVARTLMEAPAVEIEELYLQMFLGLRDAIPVATFQSFGFDKLQPAYAHGFVSISRATAPAEDITIFADTVFTAADGRTYKTSQYTTWLAGRTSVNVPVVATVIGLAGNITRGLITSSPSFGTEYTISNADITTGRDLETDSEREIRFAEYIRSLSRGTTYACEYAAAATQVLDENGAVYEYVTRSGLVESGGRVRIYLYSSRGLPSAELLAAAQKIIDGYKDPVTGKRVEGYRAGGIRFDVLSMSERLVPLGIKVAMLDGYDLDASVRQDLADIFASELAAVAPGEVLQLGTLVEALLGAAGVLSVVPTTEDNIVCGLNEALKPGTLTISAL